MTVRTWIVALLVCISVHTARADKEYVPWYKGPFAKHRIVHMSLTGAAGAAYLLTSIGPLSLNPTSCRWCSPPGFDASVRNALVWTNVGRADTLSTIDAYAVTPIVGIALLYVADKDASWTRLIDDTLPVAETVAFSELFTNVVKYSFARERPYKYFGGTATEATKEDNTSFISGHSVLGFSITSSAGLICHWRGYWTEPYVWAAGITLSLSTEYLRMAADKHYLSDVLVGGFVGIGFGLTVPRLMQHDVLIVPVSNGAAIVGSF